MKPPKQQTEANAVEYLSKVNQFAKNNNTNKPKEQTAVEWLESQLLKQKSILKNHFEEGKWNDDRCDEIDNCLSFIQQAKEMEKEKIVKAYNQDLYGRLSGYRNFDDGEDYYNQTYGGGEQ